MRDRKPKSADTTVDFERTTYNINGVETVVLSIGTGPALVFLHGAGTFTGFEIARQWAETHKVIIPHHPGFGDSGDSETVVTIDDYVLHYMDLFDELQVNNFSLAGFSVGAWIAAEFAIRQPERIERLILVAPAGLVVDEALAPDMLQIAPPELPGYLTHDIAKVLEFFPTEPDPDFEARLNREVGSVAKLLSGNPQGNPKLASWLHRISMPTLLIWGAEDRLRPVAQSKKWLELLPDARLDTIAATGHLVFEETPVAGRLVNKFLVD